MTLDDYKELGGGASGTEADELTATYGMLVAGLGSKNSRKSDDVTIGRRRLNCYTDRFRTTTCN